MPSPTAFSASAAQANGEAGWRRTTSAGAAPLAYALRWPALFVILAAQAGATTYYVDPATGRGRIAGDVADGVDEVAAWLSPNPGGVGPMTRAMLLVNVVESCERQVAGEP